jgi:hypothetical protein
MVRHRQRLAKRMVPMLNELAGALGFMICVAIVAWGMF